jgi:RNA polymerase primary sigma factor
VDVLTREQEAVAFTLIRQGDEPAKEQFVYFNQPLIGWVARRYLDKGLSWEELCEAGNVGLLQAVNRFDPSKGYKFSTFAVPWIEGEIKQLVASNKRQKQSDRSIRQSDGGVALVDSVPKDEEESEIVDGATLQNGDSPSEEASEEPGRSEEHVDLQEAVAQNAEVDGGLGMNPHQARAEGIGSHAGHALEVVVGSDDPLTDYTAPGSGARIDFAPDWSMCNTGADNDHRPALEQSIQRLEDPRQRTVLAMSLALYGHKQHTFAEIGDALGVTAQRAHAIQKQAMVHLREDATLQMIFDLLN